MSWVRRLYFWLRALFARDTIERDLDREMRFHLAMEVEKNVRDGMSAPEARRRALVDFGGVQRFREEVNDQRGTRALADIVADFRYGVRTLRKNPGFSLVAILTLAIGIGATTAVFSLANWVLFRPVPGIAWPEELVIIRAERPTNHFTGFSYPNFVDLRDAAPSLDGLMGHGAASVQLSSEGLPARPLDGEMVFGDYFGVLGVRPDRGRFFTASELEPASEARVVIISHRLWHSYFRGAPDVVGRRVTINAAEFRLIGVAPIAFRGTDRVDGIDIWLPGPVYSVIWHSPKTTMADRDDKMVRELVGRLKPGATPELAQQQLRRAMEGLVSAYPTMNAVHTDYPPTVHAGVGTPVYQRDRVGPTIRLLLGIVALVFLVACANAANLLLFRGVRRRGEFAVRRALGASGGRLLRQHLVEGLVLSTAGGLVGVGLAVGLVHLFDGQVLPGFPPIAEVPIDLRVLVFAFGLSLITGMLAGLVPAVAAARRDHLGNLVEASRTIAGGSWRIRSGLTLVQIGASMTLGVGALLLSRTLVNLHRVDLGFEPSGVTVFWIQPDPQGYAAPRQRALRQHLVDRVASQPGVDAVTVASIAPFDYGYTMTDLRADDDRTTTWPVTATSFAISPDYFETLGIPLLAGRIFTAAEFRADSASAPDGVLISRTLSNRLFGDGDPTGRWIVQRTAPRDVSRLVLGVVGDVRSMGLRGDAEPIIYEALSFEGRWRPSRVQVLVRSGRPQSDVEALVDAAVAEFDPSLPVAHAESMVTRVGSAMTEERLFARLVSLLAGIACLLTAVGLYSLIAYSVEERRREIGVRMALGAHTGAIVRLFVRQAGSLVVIGLVVGTGFAIVLSRTLESRLFGVARLDALTYGAAAAVLVVLGVVASAVPARNASRVNPVETLRLE
jgi:putative ABC transport system permease protein